MVVVALCFLLFGGTLGAFLIGNGHERGGGSRSHNFTSEVQPLGIRISCSDVEHLKPPDRRLCLRQQEYLRATSTP
jgi:hypothetical protein